MSLRKITSMAKLEELGRMRLSKSFFMRDFLYSEIANFHEIANYPENPELAIQAGTGLCEELLEPLQDAFGRISIRSGYRSKTVNQYGNDHKLNCASNEKNYGAHIWDERDSEGRMGATACIVVNRYIDMYEKTKDFRPLAWWIHDHLPYSTLYFFPKLCAFNIRWREDPVRRIDSYVSPKGCLTKPGMDNHAGDHQAHYVELLDLKL